MNVRLMCFPASDSTFVDLAHLALTEAGARPRPEDVQQLLRPTYPQVVVRVQDAAATVGFGVRWYAFRDGRVEAGSIEAWWDDPDVARVVIDHTNRYTEANDAACRLLGVPVGGLVGRSWEEFAEPETAAAAEALRQTMQRRGHAASTFQLIRPDGGRFTIDYHSVIYVSDATVLYETALRERPRSTPAGASPTAIA
ncbi:MAG: PAS domain-containing protein [Candidatus Limnocylindrales bacterium]